MNQSGLVRDPETGRIIGVRVYCGDVPLIAYKWVETTDGTVFILKDTPLWYETEAGPVLTVRP